MRRDCASALPREWRRAACGPPTCAAWACRPSLAVAYEQFRDELDQAAAEELAARRPAPGSRLEYRQQLLAERRRQEALRADGPRRAGRPRLSVAHLAGGRRGLRPGLRRAAPAAQGRGRLLYDQPHGGRQSHRPGPPGRPVGLKWTRQGRRRSSDPWQRGRRARAPDCHQGVHGTARRRGCAAAAGWGPEAGPGEGEGS